MYGGNGARALEWRFSNIHVYSVHFCTHTTQNGATRKWEREKETKMKKTPIKCYMWRVRRIYMCVSSAQDYYNMEKYTPNRSNQSNERASEKKKKHTQNESAHTHTHTHFDHACLCTTFFNSTNKKFLFVCKIVSLCSHIPTLAHSLPPASAFSFVFLCFSHPHLLFKSTSFGKVSTKKNENE